MRSILFFCQGARRRVIRSERAERARAKDLLEDAWRMRAQGVVPEGRSFAPGGKQVLRACGAQDDSARSLRGGENCRGAACCAPTHPSFSPKPRVSCHPERARAERARAKDLLEDAWRMRAKGASEGPSAGDGGNCGRGGAAID